jgi:hypothetical protein
MECIMFIVVGIILEAAVQVLILWKVFDFGRSKEDLPPPEVPSS